MKKPLLGKAGRSVAGAVVAMALGIASAAAGTDNEHVALLRPLGAAYAEDYGTVLTDVTRTATTTVTADNKAELTERLQKALVMGVIGRDRSFRALALESLEGALKFRMAGDLSPAESVTRLLEQDFIVAEMSWRFSKSPAVTSFAVFSKEGELLFDTLLSLPAMPEALLFPRHF